MAVNSLKEIAQRAINAVVIRNVTNSNLKIWLKIFDSVIQPIVLYCSEVWGPLIMATLLGTNIQQELYMQNSADTFYTHT